MMLDLPSFVDAFEAAERVRHAAHSPQHPLALALALALALNPSPKP